MKNKFLFTVIITSFCLLIFIFKSFAQDNHTKKTFKVSNGGDLSVSIAAGDIQVKTWDKNEVEVLYYDEDDYSEIKIYQNGRDIFLRSDSYIDFEITVPTVFNINLNSSGGDIKLLGNLKGEAIINTAGGDIQLKDVVGEINANTAGGDIRCGNIKGSVTLSSSGGDLTVGKVDGECKVSTGGGDVIVDNVGKTLTVSTGGGNITSGNVGDNVVITTGGGDVSVSNISGTTVLTTGGGNVTGTKLNKGGTVVTGAGDVVLKNISGEINVTSGAGNVISEFTSVGNRESKIITGYGDITVYIPENAKATIEATVKVNSWPTDKTEISESIKSDFKSTTEEYRKGEYHAVYIINGGGTNIELETSLGQIIIKKLKR